MRRRTDPDELADIAIKIARTSKSEALRLQALQWLRDSGYTRPAERHELALEQTNPRARDASNLSTEQLEERLAWLRALPAVDAKTDGNE